MTLAENPKNEIIKLSVKGIVQSTIPTDVLTALELKPGDGIIWEIKEIDGEIVAIAKKR